MACSNCSFNKTSNHNDSSTVATEMLGGKTSFDWLNDIPDNSLSDIIEVRFKNNRKEFYRNVYNLNLAYNDLVTVQVQAGFDVGVVALKGFLAEKQFKRKAAGTSIDSLRIIYRKSNENDLRSWKEGKQLEQQLLIETREVVEKMNLEMKVSDVEFQGDKKKATFYYISSIRVDFRELIKVLATRFNIKVEMRQIGARQETAKIGGIGSCGRELCCSSWRNELPSVTSSSLQAQQLSSSMEKYMGQCGKLKCCLMYELATYLESKADFPKELLELETKRGIAFPYKIDILQKTVWYTFKQGPTPESPVEIPLERVKEVITLNKRGVKVENL
ncbi:MAG TPA: regulatory iron-sulfur-containing complex subunit RicT [Bacteroidales bacterium]|nr:regulatory iron-sulfur-containing complex subunit RicT [Bacteroidales bacterium]